MFKAGDRVRCINNENIETQLTLGKIYEVVLSNEYNYIVVMTDCNYKDSFDGDMFELVKEIEHKTIVIDGIEYYLVPKE